MKLLRWSCAPHKSRQVAAQLRLALPRVAVSAVSQSLASKPRLAVEPWDDDGDLVRAMVFKGS